MKKRLPLVLSVALALSGCAHVMTFTEWFFTGQINSHFTEEEAFNQLEQARQSFYDQHVNKPKTKQLWNQPVNKKERCLLPISAEMKKDSNFKQYWDGACKNGYAFGLGRDIVLSDNYHVEEIINHDRKRKGAYGPVLWRDFNNNVTARGFIFGKYGIDKQIVAVETLIETSNGDAIKKVDKTYSDGSVLYKIEEDDIAKKSVVIAIEDGIRYLEFNQDAQYGSHLPRKVIMAFAAHLQNPPEGTFVQGVSAEGRIQDGYIRNGQPQRADVMSDTYWNNINQAINRAKSKLADESYYTKARRLEKLYLRKLKQGDFKVPRGLSADKYYEILDYYSDEFADKERSTLLKRAQQKESEDRQQAHQAAVIAQEKAVAAAEAAAQQAALTNQINAINAQTQQNINALRSSTPNVQVQPMRSPVGGPAVYRSQRINDNMELIQRVR